MKPDGINELGGIENLGEMITRASNPPSGEIFQELLASNECQLVVGSSYVKVAAVVAQRSGSVSW